jgi:hypothetical protein
MYGFTDGSRIEEIKGIGNKINHFLINWWKLTNNQ